MRRKSLFHLFLVLGFLAFAVYGAIRVFAVSEFSVTLTAYFDEYNVVETEISHLEQGDEITIEYDSTEYAISYFLAGGSVSGSLPTGDTYTVTASENLIAIFCPSGKYVALFLDQDGNFLDVQYILPGGNATDLNESLLPNIDGYVLLDPKWNNSLENITHDTIFTLRYVPEESTSYSVSVIGGSGGGMYEEGTVAEVSANLPTEGLYFNYWLDGTSIVSLENDYSFTVVKDMDLKAVYSDSLITDTPFVSVNKDSAQSNRFYGQIYLPEGFEADEYGVIASMSEITTIDSVGATAYQGAIIGSTGEFLAETGSTVYSYYKGYLTATDANGNQMTVYGEQIVEDAGGIYATDLFISYYMEGSSYNKALAIFNGTGNTVDLSEYTISIYSNGSVTSTGQLSLSGSLAHGEVYVIANASASASIQAMADLISSSTVINYNGDDALELKHNGNIIDSFGQVGNDPGDYWSSGSVSTKDMSLKRKSSIYTGRTASSSAFDPSIEWNAYLTDSTTGLDSHTFDGIGDAGMSGIPISIEAYIPDMTYEAGEEIDLTGSYLKVFYDNCRSEVMELQTDMISGFDTSTGGTFTLVVTYSGLTDSLVYVTNEPIGSQTLIVYDIYGGGGNTGATYKNDYIVLYNKTNQSIDLTGYSLQYGSATGTTYTVLALSGTISKNNYYLVKLASGGDIGSELPVTANLTGGINMAATSGKIAIVDNLDAITGIDDENVIDFVGYGSANEYETSPAATISAILSDKRIALVDTDNNGDDFAIATPDLTYISDNATIDSLSVKNLQKYYEQGDSLVLVSSILVLHYSNGTTADISLEASMITGFSTTLLGTFEMTITYEEITYQYEYYVVDYSSLNSVEIYYIDLGYAGGGPGEATLIQVGGIDILVDAGENGSASKTALLGFLEDYVTDGVIEYIVATHPHDDHIGGFDIVFANYVVENAIVYTTDTSYTSDQRTEFENDLLSEGTTVSIITDLVALAEPVISVASGVDMRFYDTGYLESDEPNASSIVFVLEAFNTRVLFNGDAESSQEAVYAPQVGDVDIFKMGHHGSTNGTSALLLEDITPEVAIVNNGDHLGNEYNHPTYTAISRIYQYSDNVPVYSVTGGDWDNLPISAERNGTIDVSISGSGYVITSENYGANPIEISNTAYWSDVLNPSLLSYYYATATGITDGVALKAALNDIISGHTVYDYGDLADIMKVIDVDPSNSSNIMLFYTGRSIPNTNYNISPDGWNKEHIWAQSHGIDGVSPAYSDLHHLRPTDVSVNSLRGDLDYGEATTLVSDTYGDVETYCYYSSSYFEPRDEIKGDVARMLFYMAVRYEGESGEPDLELVNGTTSSDSSNIGDLATLLLWNIADTVDAYEKNRDNLVYGYQGNRNPFIDHPEWVDIIFGGDD